MKFVWFGLIFFIFGLNSLWFDFFYINLLGNFGIRVDNVLIEILIGL